MRMSPRARAGRATTPRRCALTPTRTQIIARYPQPRSALLPMLHLVQSEDGYVSPRRHRVLRGAARPHHRRGVRGRDVLHAVQAPPERRRTPSASAPTRCARSWAATRSSTTLEEHLGVGHDETTDDGADHARAHRVQRGLRLRAGRDGQLGVLRQPDAGQRHGRSSTTCAPGEPVRPDPRRGHASCTFKRDVPGAGRVPRRARRRGRRRRGADAAPVLAELARAERRPRRRRRRGRPRPGRGGRQRGPRGAHQRHGRAGGGQSQRRAAGGHRQPPAEATAGTSRAASNAAPTERRGKETCMATTLTPVLTDTWDQDRSWTLDDLRGARRLRRRCAPRPGMDAGRRRHDGQGLRPARPRRRGLPDRHEVGLPAHARRRPALPRRQRRRVRAGHLQGHPADDGQPAAPDRGRASSPATRSAADHAFIYVRGEVAARLPPAAARRRGGVRGGLPRQGHPRLRLRPRHHRARRRRRVHLRRGDGAARLARGPPRPAAAEAAVPRRRRPVRAAHGGQQRRVDRVACPRSSTNGADWFAGMGTEKSTGYGLFSLSGHVTPAGPVRGAARHHAARAARHGRRHPRGPRAEVLDAGRLVDADVHRRAPRRPARLRVGRRGRARCSAPARCRSSTRRPAWSARCCAGPSSTRTSPAASARRAARAPTGWCRCCAGSRPGEGSEADLDKLLDMCDNILGRVVLRARRRRDQPDHVVASSTSATSTRRHLTERRLPVRPGAPPPCSRTPEARTGHPRGRRRRGH